VSKASSSLDVIIFSRHQLLQTMAVPPEKKLLCSLPPEILIRIYDLVVPQAVDVGFINEIQTRDNALTTAPNSVTTPEAALPENLKPSVPLSAGWGSTTALLLSCGLLNSIATRCLHRCSTIRFQNPSMIPPLLKFENIAFDIGLEPVAWTKFFNSSIHETLPRLRKLHITIFTLFQSPRLVSTMRFEDFEILCSAICNNTAHIDYVTVRLENFWVPYEEVVTSMRTWKEISRRVYCVRPCG
jgi:hypothetical protein